MKKLLVLTLLSASLFGCSNQATQTIVPLQNTSVAASSNSNWGPLLDGMNLKKDLTLKQLSKNTITVKADDINRDKNTLLVHFSNGDIAPNSHFHVVLSVKINDDQYSKKGDSYMNVESSYFSGFSLTKAEAYKLLKTASNYSKFAAQFDKVYK